MTTYIAGYNNAGYLPEMEPQDFDCFEDARQFLVDELKVMEAEDCAGHEDAAESYCHAAEDVNLWTTPQAVLVNGQEFWIHQTD